MLSLDYMRYLREWIGNRDGISSRIFKLHSSLRPAPMGRVDLVGAGPGDPELLTLKAWRLINEADTIVYDALVSRELLEGITGQPELIYVGKRKGDHSASQDEICSILVRLALKGKHVVRLKGGDPLVFGRLGEELDALRSDNIPYSIVPGITAASGCAASLGFPLTERGKSTRLRLVTAQFSETRKIDWSNLARTDETLVFYMGVSKATMISAELIQAGLPASHPVLIVENGTHKEQRAVETTLSQMTEAIDLNRIEAPALIYVGLVVAGASMQIQDRVNAIAM
ncbi:uroporphyrinogen-III C-methyltransferase [uncultured Amphritea sp.]|uniref:uroporphyrinogen-III C-methyltransferase n=1 Tax=uncultured Amphritea sp. TaxID=981605 RepID=UPI0025F50BC8|nr:uroporphyrinogen-III C-methyltransferase [uncultured Amphritea sp.]